LIFFGLLGFYFASLRTFRYNALPDVWRNLIVFLNVFSVAAVLCSLSSRFVYPQLSLEGQAFWIIGLSPAGLRRVLLTKFFTALAAMATISVALIALSTTMLGVAPLLKGVTVSLSLAIALGTCGLSTGLGAVFLDLKQSNPMAIVSSFGGTLNLALSLIFMAVVILPCAIPFHFLNLGKIGPTTLYRTLGIVGPAIVVLTLLTTILPLWLGLRSLQRREY
jgi:ABC-2 type transport system permease protein